MRSLVLLFRQYFLWILLESVASPPGATVAFVAWCDCVSVSSCAFVVLVLVFIWGHWVSSAVCTTRGIGGHELIFRTQVFASSPNCSRRKPSGKT